MAERRMFTKKIVDSDAFLDMPLSAQALYFHLNMRADDDGFVNNPKKIQRMIGASDDDMKLLMVKRFLICFESGVVVIKHWRMHNLIRKDRHVSTQYIEELNRLEVKSNSAYTEKPLIKGVSGGCQPNDNQMTTNCQPNDNQWLPQVSIVENSLDEDSLVECSVEDADNNKLEKIGGMGRNVVYLTNNQFDSLIDKLGVDAFDRYVSRLADFIIEKNAHVKNHYETILKWFKEDSGVKE